MRISFLCREVVVQWIGKSLSEIKGMEVYWQNYSVNIPVPSLSKVCDTLFRRASVDMNKSLIRQEVAMCMVFGELVALHQLKH